MVVKNKQAVCLFPKECNTQVLNIGALPGGSGRLGAPGRNLEVTKLQGRRRPPGCPRAVPEPAAAPLTNGALLRVATWNRGPKSRVTGKSSGVKAVSSV